MITPISIERVASKLQWLRSQGEPEADRRLATPRYVETLCFLSAMSRMPGGLERFLSLFLAASGDWVKALPGRVIFSSGWHGRGVYTHAWEQEVFRLPSGHLNDALLWALPRWCGEQSVPDMADFCFSKFDKLFPGFMAAMAKFMNEYAATQFCETADTVLRRRVFEELEFARRSKHVIPVVMVADTRHGKTTAGKTYCGAWPGRLGLITVPESGDEREFYGAHADALGMDWTPRTSRADLKARVQYVVAQTRLCLLYDEAHNLVPRNNSPPRRLEWVRAKVIDRGVPCAFLFTPQNEQETLQGYARRVWYNMEQIFGRMPKPVLLSDLPSREDLMAVARNQYPKFSDRVLGVLCDGADFKIGLVPERKRDGKPAIEPDKKYSDARRNGESGLKVIVQAGDRAEFLAEMRGVPAVTEELIREGLEYALGSGFSALLATPDRANKAPGSEYDFPGVERTARGRRVVLADGPLVTRGSGAVTETLALAVPA